MTNETFEDIFNNQISTCKETLILKAKEYARDGDRLHNFKKASDMLGTNPVDALWGMMMKHLVSVSDIVDDTWEGKYPKDGILAEKITDVINYFILLKAVIIDMETK